MDKKKILIVDDDADVRRGLTVRLRANNYDVVYAVDAISAISAARKEKPDVILLDLGLPGGDGFVVMERLQAINVLPSVPVIVVSARDAVRNKDRALAAGAEAFFQKPAENDELLAAIRTAVGDSPAAASG